MTKVVARSEKHRRVTGTTICEECRTAWPCNYEKGRTDAATRLWRYFKDECGPISGKGMTAGPVCVDEAVAVVEGTRA